MEDSMFQKYLFHCTEKCIGALNIGIKEMVNMKKSVLSSEFVLLGLIEQHDSAVMRIIDEMGLNFDEIRDSILADIYTKQQAETELKIEIEPSFNVSIAHDVEQLFQLAFESAKDMGDKYISAGLLFVTMLKEGTGAVREILLSAGLTEDDTVKAYDSFRSGRRIEDRKSDSKEDILSKYTVDMTALARKGKFDPVIGRDDLIMQMIRVLSRRNKNNPIMIGPPGVGKTVLIEGLAQRIIDAEVPETLLRKRIVRLEVAELLAGAKFKGDFEERFKEVKDEVMNAAGSIILFIDDFHTILSSTGSGEGSASDMLKPALATGMLQCIGTTTVEEYKRYVESDKALARRIQPIKVDEPSVDETIEMIGGLVEKYESHHGVVYSKEAIVAAVRMSNRYISERYLPDKAIDVIDDAGATKHLSTMYIPPHMKTVEVKKLRLLDEQHDAFARKDFKKVADIQQQIIVMEQELKVHKDEWHKDVKTYSVDITEEDVAEVISRWTGIPLTRLIESEKEKLSHMEDNLHKRIVGQEPAVTAVCNAIRRNRAGLKLHNRPIGSFLFLGPTGVGKTELAKALSEFLLDNEDRIIRLDMSEYQERHTVSKIIGAPPGYIGYGEGGQLTERVRRNPYSVILLDELEKAHFDVFNILLQVLDNGKLTDGQGLEVNFRNTVIIGTSNIGGEILAKEIKRVGFVQTKGLEGYAEMKTAVMAEVKKFFRPEFINRIDDIIVFHPLTKDHIRKIVDLELAKLISGMMEQNIKLEVDDKVRDLLAETGYSETYGARPLKREIEQRIENPISQLVIAQHIGDNPIIRATLGAGNEIEIVRENIPADAG
jgi:ATP-dependent Clp protease ATP-binding subunit ClpC